MAGIQDIQPGHILYPVKDALMRAFNLTETGYEGKPMQVAYKPLSREILDSPAFTDRDKRALEAHISGEYAGMELLTGDGYSLLRIHHSLSGMQAHVYETEAMTLSVRAELLDADIYCGGMISGAMMRFCELKRLGWIKPSPVEYRDTRAMAVYLIEERMKKTGAPRPA